MAYGSLGDVFAIRGELEQAEQMLERSLELFKEVGAMSSAESIQSVLKRVAGRML